MKMKKSFIFLLCVALFYGLSIRANAQETISEVLDAEEVLYDYIEAINSKKWVKVSQFYMAEKRAEMKTFLLDNVNQNEHKGLLNVKEAEIVEVVKVDFEDAQYLLLDEYDGKIVETYIVGIDYSTYENTEYYSNGVCYEIYSFVYETNEWKIAEKRTVWDFAGLVEAGYIFDTRYESTINVINARQNGIILSFEGQYVRNTFSRVECDEGETLSGRASNITSYAIPTENTQITYYNKTNSQYYTQGFHTMCKAITYAEVGSDRDFGGYCEARKACIMAIKTYVWHFYIIQESKDAGYHISSSQIAYNSNYQSTYDFLTDYSAVQNVWMQGTSSTGNPIVFEANFKAGSMSDQSQYKYGGDLKQLGCIYLLNTDSSVHTYKDLLHYYYDYSPRSQGGPVQFFDANKNFI